MPRFVLLYHDCPPHYARPSHWDFMLESGDTLRTWALETLPRAWHAAHARTIAIYPHCPALAEGDDVAAEQLGDHRREYLEFEGDLSDNRGSVIRVAAGIYATITESPTFWQFSLTESDGTQEVHLSRPSATATSWELRCV